MANTRLGFQSRGDFWHRIIKCIRTMPLRDNEYEARARLLRVGQEKWRHAQKTWGPPRRRVVQWMDEELFGCCTRTLTTREVVTGRQSCNTKRKRFPRSTSPDSKTWPAAGVGQYS